MALESTSFPSPSEVVTACSRIVDGQRSKEPGMPLVGVVIAGTLQDRAFGSAIMYWRRRCSLGRPAIRDPAQVIIRADPDKLARRKFFCVAYEASRAIFFARLTSGDSPIYSSRRESSEMGFLNIQSSPHEGGGGGR